jgi:signal transduction histidine kinase/HAMP domain-containing protein
MRLSIKTKQVAGVVLLVGLAVTILSGVYTALIAGVLLKEADSRGVMLKQFIFERALRVITSREHAYGTLRDDPGLRILLESSMAYSKHVVYAAIVDPRNVVIVHSSSVLEGQTLEPQPLLESVLEQSPWRQLEAISSDRTFEVTEKLLLRDEGRDEASGNEQFGAIRIGISTTLIWDEALVALKKAVYISLAALGISTLLAFVLAQWTLRPVHVLKSGLTRLGKGEFDVKLDLPPGDEFSELGTSFNQLSAELTAVRSQLATGQAAPLESVVDRLEDAVAMLNPDGQVVFANAALRTALPEASPGSPLSAWPELHPYRRLVDRALQTKRSQGPIHQMVLIPGETGETEQWLMAHAVEHADQRFIGVMLVARDVGYINQVQSTLSYSRKAASLGRLLAGVAHEVKNPLNAMTIHLELLKQKLSGGRPAGARALAAGPSGEGGRGSAAVATETEAPTSVVVEVPGVMKHVTVIGAEIRRLDEVVQGFLKFSRPDELNLEPIDLGGLVGEVIEVVEPQARDVGVRTVAEFPQHLPHINADRTLLRQALLNLALNAVQAMPQGGGLRFVGKATTDRRVALDVEDTGVGISPEHLSRIFDLYFTTREGGSGIGLSMVFRTVQLLDGHIEVQSTPGRGTTFTILLPQA